MASWSSQRKFLYGALVIVVVLVPLGLFIFFNTYEAPTCFDGRKNQDEAGVDCGGSCVILCDSQAIEPIVLWQRYFEIVPGTYSVVAYVENPNPSVWARDVEYIFKIYDLDGVLVYEGPGKSDLPPRQSSPIFQTSINLGARTPSRMSFELKEVGEWQKDEEYKNSIQVVDRKFERLEESPRVEVEIKNSDIKELRELELVALVFDSSGNALGASRTFLDSISAEDTKTLVFTWPNPFSGNPAKIEVIPVY